MAQSEISLQYDLFTGQPVDNRTRTQKQQDAERDLPKQVLLFSQREIGQFGVNPKPLLPISDTTRLILIPEDHRSVEDIERDTQREAERLTMSLLFEVQNDRSEFEVNEEPDQYVGLFLITTWRQVYKLFPAFPYSDGCFCQ